MKKTIKIQNIEIGDGRPFTLIAGPCQIETLEHARMMAQRLVDITSKLGVSLIYKSSFDKANRTSINGKRGVGLAAGLEILAQIKTEFNLPILTDVHESTHCATVAQVADVLQIPAFLCRQTDLIVAAAQTGRAINVKKGQFLAPEDMQAIVTKIESTGNKKILLTERGTSFGYHRLVNDFRALPIMAQTGYPVVFDATHSVQEPSAKGDQSGGQREFVEHLSKAAVAVGIDALFLEVHENPDRAPSDGATMLQIEALETLLERLKHIERAVKP